MEETIKCGIYKITSPSGRIYIGQSKNIFYRWSQYNYPGYKSNAGCILDKSLSKYGSDSHSFEIIEECLETDLDKKEIHWIDYYKSNYRKYPKQKGLNLTDGGNKPPIRLKPLSDKSKKVISLKNKLNHINGKYSNVYKIIVKQNLDGTIIEKYESIEDFVDKTGISRKKFQKGFTEFNKFYRGDFIYSFEDSEKFNYKLKIIKKKNKIIKHTNKMDSIEHSEYLSEKMLKIRTREEWSRFFSDLNTGRSNKMRKWTEQEKQERKEHLLKIHLKNQKKVIQMDKEEKIIQEFNSIKEAADHIKGKYQFIGNVCRGIKKTAYGYKWKFKKLL